MFSIYSITNLINGKIYVGKTTQLPKKRLSKHFSCAFKEGSDNLIHQALRKYGKQNFQFDIIYCSFEETYLSEAEQHFIKEYNTCILDEHSHGYNMTRGGDGFTTETGRKYSGANKPGWVNPWSGVNGSALASKQNKDRAKLGTNPWAGERGSIRAKENVKKQIEAGVHPFQDKQKAKVRVQKQLENGTHNFLTPIHWTCPHCNKNGIGTANANRWHFDKCKSKL
jgi:group I intron endonuclease